MAHSKNVLAVVGMLCVNARFRRQFFNRPEAYAKGLVGELTADERAQVLRLAGNLIDDLQRAQYQSVVSSACEKVSAAMGCDGTCPTPPCPCPDNDDVSPSASLQ
jgi:hypothetical protein